MIQALWVPGFFPTPLNKLMGHHMAAARLKARDAEMIGRAALAHQAAKATGPRRVDLHLIVAKGQRKVDRDAPLKSSLDALVLCGMLKNDSPAWCRVGQVTYSRAEDQMTGTLILLEDLP